MVIEDVDLMLEFVKKQKALAQKRPHAVPGDRYWLGYYDAKINAYDEMIAYIKENL